MREQDENHDDRDHGDHRADGEHHGGAAAAAALRRHGCGRPHPVGRRGLLVGVGVRGARGRRVGRGGAPALGRRVLRSRVGRRGLWCLLGQVWHRRRLWHRRCCLRCLRGLRCLVRLLHLGRRGLQIAPHRREDRRRDLPPRGSLPPPCPRSLADDQRSRGAAAPGLLAADHPVGLVAHRVGVGEAFRRVLPQRPRDQRVHRGQHRAVELRRRGRGLLDVLVGDRQRRVPVEGQLGRSAARRAGNPPNTGRNARPRPAPAPARATGTAGCRPPSRSASST